MKRLVVHLTVWAMALAGVLATVVLPSSASAAPLPAGNYVSLTPTRLLDTRNGTGAPTGAVAPAGTVTLQVTGQGGVPATGVSAVVLNVTAVAPTRAGFITAYGPGTRPTVSNLNFTPGQTVPNLVIVPVSATGTVKLYNGSSGTTQLLADVAGYYIADPAPAAVTAFKTTTITSTSIAMSWVNPTDAAFTGVIIRRAAGATAPATRTAGVLVVDAAKPATTADDTGLTSGTQYSYAAFAHDGAGNDAAAATFTATTAPDPVTNLAAVPSTGATVQVELSWTDPTNASFSGVMIRRATGAVAPTTITDGDLVIANRVASQYVDGVGLTPLTQYSYSVFAHDAAGSSSVATTVTVTTTAAPVNAVLSVNDSTGATAKTSVGGFEPTFVVTGSTPGPGEDLVSGSLNYGDGTTQDFTGPVADWVPAHQFLAPGARIVTLVVTDSAGNSDSAVVTVTVFAPPTATITTAGGLAEESITFGVTTSTPATTAITDYEFDFGDGTGLQFATGTPPATLNHIYTATGTYTVSFSAYNDADGIANATTQVVVGQGPVTDLTTTTVTNTSITLVWTNPINTDFTGVTIRRAVGTVAPAGPAAGVAVPIPASPVTVSFTDSGLAAGTTYSYAVFANGGASQTSVAAEVTETTTTPAGAVPTAALSINNSTGATAKASLNGFPALFDLTGSQASAGQTLTAGTLDFGDGATTFFGGDPTLWDGNHEYTTAGVKTVTWTVQDSGGGSDTTVVTLTVFVQPSASITGPATSVPDAVVTFNLTAVTPLGTDITDWDISVDGIQVAESGVGTPPATFNWQFDAPGVYPVTLSVFNDADGNATSVPVTVTVN